MKKPDFLEISGRRPRYYALLTTLTAVLAVGLGAAYYMEHHGHIVTGMTNQIVWGLPHVFAVSLIVAASGALNVASIASVFGKSFYKPLAPLSGLLAVALLIGGLVILVLDLGRPDRLLVAMTHYNFKSIFAWNIFLYTGFLAVVCVYLWMMLERRFNHYSRTAGFVAFVWRVILTTGTGSIFGFLVAREAYDTAILAPLFIALSLSIGLAVFLLVLIATFYGSGRPLGGVVSRRLQHLLGVFVAVVLLLVTIFHLTPLYASQHSGVETFLLAGANVYTALFWLGYVVFGSVVPLALLYRPRTDRQGVVAAAVLVLFGGVALMYVIIIGGQAYPLALFPGYEATSEFFDGVVSDYRPSLPEALLGAGGAALAAIIVIVGIKLFRFLPVSLADTAVDPHYEPTVLDTTGAQASADSV